MLILRLTSQPLALLALIRKLDARSMLIFASSLEHTHRCVSSFEYISHSHSLCLLLKELGVERVEEISSQSDFRKKLLHRVRVSDCDCVHRAVQDRSAQSPHLLGCYGARSRF